MFIQTKYLNTNINRTDLCIIMTKTVALAKCHPTLCEPLLSVGRNDKDNNNNVLTRTACATYKNSGGDRDSDTHLWVSAAPVLLYFLVEHSFHKSIQPWYLRHAVGVLDPVCIERCVCEPMCICALYDCFSVVCILSLARVHMYVHMHECVCTRMSLCVYTRVAVCVLILCTLCLC